MTFFSAVSFDILGVTAIIEIKGFSGMSAGTNNVKEKNIDNRI